MTFSPGSQLGPYQIVAELGSGGMGVVYEARDPRLKRTVAIKLLPPDLTKDATAKQRFLQEAQAASALDHPNICTIHEINETDDGQLYLVMAHYEGETLKERVETGPLALGDAIDIATQVGTGLAEAHQAGIVHRDIKPANLFVTKSGTVKILDFGLAKLAGTEGVTQTGTTVGTVAYMSPEQARGQEVDHRTDIWALGVVLYEMLAGQPPFQGQNLLSLAAAIRSQEPEPLTGAASGAFGPVSRALSKETATRYASVTDLVSDLRTGASSPTPVVTSPAKSDIPSIAVLPFTNISADPEQVYFCDGLAEDLINGLAQLEGLRVVARTSAFQFRGKDLDLRDVGRTLNVKTVLEGSVRRSGNRLRVAAQLINAADGYHLWSERFDRTMEDVFALQDEIARTVVEKLRVKLLNRAEPLVKGQGNIEAFQWFLRGRHALLEGTSDGYAEALEYFEKALSEQHNYAEALAGMAWVYGWQSMMGCLAPPKVLMPRAKDAVLRALKIDDGAPMAHLVLAELHLYYDWDWPRAEGEYRRAVALNPGFADAHTNYCLFLAIMGRSEESIAGAQRAISLDPIGLHPHRMLSVALRAARRYSDAEQEAERTLELDPSFVPAYWELVTARAELGEPERVLEACERGRNYSPEDPTLMSWHGWACGKVGRRQQAEGLLMELKQRRQDGYFSAALIAGCYVGLGDVNQAVDWLQVAYDERDGQCLFVGKSWFDPLHPDPRFQALLRRMNFPQQSSS